MRLAGERRADESGDGGSCSHLGRVAGGYVRVSSDKRTAVEKKESSHGSRKRSKDTWH